MHNFALADLIAQRMTQLKLSKTQLSRQAGISRSALYKILNAETEDLQVSTLVNLALALHEPPIHLLGTLLPSNHYYPHRPTELPTHYRGDATHFIRDVTLPDQSPVYAGSRFIKTWEIQNGGRQVWENRRLICVDEQIEVRCTDEASVHIQAQRNLQPDCSEIPIPVTRPKEKVTLSVHFTAPAYPGSVLSYWKMADHSGALCFPEHEGLSCCVAVQSV